MAKISPEREPSWVKPAEEKPQVTMSANMEEANIAAKAASIPGAAAQAESLLSAMALWIRALQGAQQGNGLNQNDEYIKDAFKKVIIEPLNVAKNRSLNSKAKEKGAKAKYQDMKNPPSKQQIKDIEFIKRVSEVCDASSEASKFAGGITTMTVKGTKRNDNSKLASEGMVDRCKTIDESFQEGGGIERRQETEPMNYKNLLKVAQWYKDGADPDQAPLSLPLWKNQLFACKLLELASAANKENDLEGYFKSAKIQCPAKLRVACAGNMRRHTITIKLNGVDVVASSLPHASHASHDLKKSKQEVDFAKDSIESVRNSGFAKSQRENLKKMLGVDGKDGATILRAYTQQEDTNKGVDDILDEIMPQIMTVDRLTSLVGSKDLNTSMVIDKAIGKIQKEDKSNKKIIGTHHTIQSGFTIFAAIGAPFMKTQNQVAAAEINKQTEVAIKILNSQKKDDDPKKKEQIQSKIDVLRGLNANYNRGLDASNKAAIMYGGSFRIATGLFVVGISALCAIGMTAFLASLPVSLPMVSFIAAGLSIAVISGGMKMFNDKYFSTNKMASSFKGLKGVALLVAVAAIVAVTAPVSLPVLGGLSVVAMGWVAGSGIFGVFASFAASKFRDGSILGGYSNHTWNAALQSLNVSLIGGIADLACHEGKDRTGTVLMTKTAYLAFIKLNDGQHPDINNVEHQQKLAEIFDVIIQSGHDAERTSYNCAGAESVKQLDHYIPPAIYSKMDSVTKDKIKSYKITTKYFSLEDTVARTEALDQADAEKMFDKADSIKDALEEACKDLDEKYAGDSINYQADDQYISSGNLIKSRDPARLEDSGLSKQDENNDNEDSRDTEGGSDVVGDGAEDDINEGP